MQNGSADKIPDIEITPEMIAAAVEKLLDYGGLEAMNAEGVVFSIFTAMVEASPTLHAFRLVDGAPHLVK